VAHGEGNYYAAPEVVHELGDDLITGVRREL